MSKAVKKTRIGRTKAVELIKNSKGRFFSITFVKNEDGSDRTINGVFSSKNTSSDLGYLLICERGNGLRNVDTRTIKSLTISGKEYSVR